MRVWTILLVLLLIPTGIGAAAVTTWLTTPEQVVEGHTVFATMAPMVCCLVLGPKATAVAVLVRENQQSTVRERFPGVLWFNDEYLIDPIKDTVVTNVTRYPCTGAVLVVNSGDPDPRSYGLAAYDTAAYVESYHVTDPNDKVWDVDKWNISNSVVWSVGIQGAGPLSGTHDDGKCNRAPIRDGARSIAPVGGYGYPCGKKDTVPAGNNCPKLQYNAVLYMLLDDLYIASTPKDHSPGSYDSTHDVAGCDPKTQSVYVDNWPCPAADDDREGNSHPYNPAPHQRGNQERVTHGYSADCTGDGVNDRDCHATRQVDVYYDVAPVPLVRVYRVFDVEGSTAPFHCEDPTAAPGDSQDVCQ